MARMQKVKKYGQALRVMMLDENGVMAWKRVGWNFATRKEASDYRRDHYPTVTKYTIMGIRLNVEPLEAPRGYVAEKAA